MQVESKPKRNVKHARSHGCKYIRTIVVMKKLMYKPAEEYRSYVLALEALRYKFATAPVPPSIPSMPSLSCQSETLYRECSLRLCLLHESRLQSNFKSSFFLVLIFFLGIARERQMAAHISYNINENIYSVSPPIRYSTSGVDSAEKKYWYIFVLSTKHYY